MSLRLRGGNELLPRLLCDSWPPWFSCSARSLAGQDAAGSRGHRAQAWTSGRLLSSPGACKPLSTPGGRKCSRFPWQRERSAGCVVLHLPSSCTLQSLWGRALALWSASVGAVKGTGSVGKQKVSMEGFGTRENNRLLIPEGWPDDKEERTAVRNLKCETGGRSPPCRRSST